MSVRGPFLAAACALPLLAVAAGWQAATDPAPASAATLAVVDDPSSSDPIPLDDFGDHASTPEQAPFPLAPGLASETQPAARVVPAPSPAGPPSDSRAPPRVRALMLSC